MWWLHFIMHGHVSGDPISTRFVAWISNYIDWFRVDVINWTCNLFFCFGKFMLVKSPLVIILLYLNHQKVESLRNSGTIYVDIHSLCIHELICFDFIEIGFLAIGNMPSDSARRVMQFRIFCITDTIFAAALHRRQNHAPSFEYLWYIAWSNLEKCRFDVEDIQVISVFYVSVWTSAVEFQTRPHQFDKYLRLTKSSLTRHRDIWSTFN